MKPINTKCPECGGAMHEGFLLDETYGSHLPTAWVEGEPVRSIWIGTKLKGKEQWWVATYRCVDCGFLKSFARNQKT